MDQAPLPSSCLMLARGWREAQRRADGTVLYPTEGHRRLEPPRAAKHRQVCPRRIAELHRADLSLSRTRKHMRAFDVADHGARVVWSRVSKALGLARGRFMSCGARTEDGRIWIGGTYTRETLCRDLKVARVVENKLDW